jgi:hypothetical protein
MGSGVLAIFKFPTGSVLHECLKISVRRCIYNAHAECNRDELRWQECR